MNQIIVGMGEALWDVLPEGKKIGGAPANFAYHVSQFGFDSRVVSAIGDDKLGNEILENFDGKRTWTVKRRLSRPSTTTTATTDLRRSPPLRASLRNSRLSASPMSSRKPSSRKTMTGAFPRTARNGQRAWMAARIMQLNSLLTV